MKELKFRRLRADEIDCRVNTINEKGLTLLLYKDARCDMNILDETIGCMNWKREHTRDNANCIVSIYNEDIKEWISKEDTGTESFTEKEKGLASDSFKRACFNWGIGRELYTAPFIWVSKDNCTISQKGDKYTTYDTFRVKDISYNDIGEINGLTIVNTKTNKVVYTMNNNYADTNENNYKEEFKQFIEQNNLDLKDMCNKYKLTSKSTNIDFKSALVQLKVEMKNAS